MKTTRLIEEYLEGKLGEEEKRDLLERLARDPDLQNLIGLHQEINESIRDEEFFHFTNRLKTVDRQYFNTDDQKQAKPELRSARLWTKYILRIAAIVFIILGTGVGIKYTLIRADRKGRLYQTYYLPYDADVISRSGQTQLILLDSAILCYARKDFEGALQKLNVLVELDKENYLAWFYRGLSCMETHQSGEAIRSFTAIPMDWDSPYNEHRDWYLALTWLKQREAQKAAVAFSSIEEKGGFYAKKAAKIRKKL